ASLGEPAPADAAGHSWSPRRSGAMRDLPHDRRSASGAVDSLGLHTPAQRLDLSQEPLVLLGAPMTGGFRLLGAAAPLPGRAPSPPAPGTGRFTALPRRQQPRAGRRVEQPELLPVSLQVEAQDLAGQATGDRLDGDVVVADQPEALQRRIEVLRPRVEQ